MIVRYGYHLPLEASLVGDVALAEEAKREWILRSDETRVYVTDGGSAWITSEGWKEVRVIVGGRCVHAVGQRGVELVDRLKV